MSDQECYVTIDGEEKGPFEEMISENKVWFVCIDGDVKGPFSNKEVKEMIEDEIIDGNTLVSHADMNIRSRLYEISTFGLEKPVGYNNVSNQSSDDKPIKEPGLLSQYAIPLLIWLAFNCLIGFVLPPQGAGIILIYMMYIGIGVGVLFMVWGVIESVFKRKLRSKLIATVFMIMLVSVIGLLLGFVAMFINPSGA